MTERILIVEDDAEMGAAMSRCCTDLGFEPILMTSYADGLKAAALSDYR